MLTIPPSLKEKRFAIFWAALLISVAGSQMQLWSLLWHVRELSDQPIVVSGIGLVRFLPILLFSLVGGAVADSFDRRKILFIAQSVMMLTAVMLGLLTLSGHIQIWQIFLLTGIQALAQSFELPARQSLTPNLVPAKVLPNAFSMQSIAFNTGSILGPALSGLVISQLGLEWVYFINAATFLSLLGAIVAIGPVPQARAAGGRRAVNLSAMQDGIRFIWRNPIVLSSMLLDFWATFFSSANTLLPFVARDVLKVNVVEYGWLSAGQSIGAVAVGLIFSQRASVSRQGPLLLGAVAVFGLATVLFGVARNFAIALFALALMGAMDTVSVIIRNTIRQLNTPDEMRGRMVGVNQIFFAGGPQLGEIEAGLVAQTFGPGAAIWTGGLGCIVAVGLIALRWPELRRYESSPAAVA